jgi:cytochrome b subunit of formate dehydrogenase
MNRWTAFILASAAMVLPLRAQENSFCLDCHDDPESDMVFATNVLARSVHGDLACIDCHDDLAGITEDHGEVKPVDCTGCHEDQAEKEAESLHGAALARGDELAPRCQVCHGSHEILPVKDPRSAVAPTRIPAVCGQCHRDGAPVQRERHMPPENVVSNYTESIHGEALYKKGLTVAPSCVSCHTAHHILPADDQRSTIARTNIAKTCSACHAMIEEVHRKVIEGERWEKEAHRLPACADCHQPHRVRKVYYDQGMADRDCMSCHGEPGIVASRDGRSLQVLPDDLHVSIHSNVACAQCHSQVQASHERPCETITEKVDCGSCHEDQERQYLRGIHGQLDAKDDPDAPDCLECHGTHRILGVDDPASPVFPINVPALCARCHREGEKAATRYVGEEHDILQHYEESIHGKGLKKSGLTVTATCADCHTAHQELPASDAESSVNRTNIAHTCARCHHGIAEAFEESIHATATTDKELPVCGDCHSAHSITRTDRDSFRMEIMDVCGKCHTELAEAYFDTYHGKVSQLGYAKTAKCQDCHGAHGIFPSSDERSSLSEANAVETCRKCHPAATPKFAGYFSHGNHHDRIRYPAMFYAFWGMTSLLVGVFVCSGIHTLLWLPRTLALRRKQKREHIGDAHGGKLFQRFRPIDRASHITMIVCFLTLTITGMTLKFAYTPWAVVIARALGGFQGCGWLHRLAAAAMFGLYVVHIWDLVFVKKKIYGSWKELFFGPNTMLFTARDLREFAQSIRWFVGRGPRPQYGRWTYWEKFDYFAVFWGIIIIGSTGLMLWFPEAFTRVLPGWWINVATIIHSDEALLAAGFIFTIHFFNTHLRPEKFPMDTVIFTGRMTIEELKEDKPEEYERLARSGELEKYLVDPLPGQTVRRMRIFGWIALTIGISVVIWIIYAMVTAYR